jgi:hypothetical protein
MEVEYELTPDDLFAFQLRAVQKSPTVKRTRRNTYIALLFAILVFAIVPAIGPGGFDPSRVSLGFFSYFFALIAALTWLFEKRMTRRAIVDLVKEEKPDKGQLGRHKLRLDETGLVESTAVGEARILWSGVDRIEHDPDYIYIYTAPSAAHLIPRRSFTSENEAEQFLQLALSSAKAVTV